MIDIINLTKKFKQNTVVNTINMQLEEGEIVGLLGPNGAGKSTTISMISSLLNPTSGDIQLHGKSILKQPKELRAILGVVPQEIALYQELSAQENLLFFGRIQKLPKDVLHDRVEEVLEIIGLQDRRKDLVKTFSGGMKRRLNIGVALLHNPKFIIMDEPTVGIDPQSRNYILETVQKLNKERDMTVLYTSHYMEEVEFLCDRIYIMDHGEIIASGTKEEIKQILSSENTVEVKLEMPSIEFEEALRNCKQITSVTSKGANITIIAPKGVNMFDMIIPISEKVHVSFISIEIKNPTLEDVFLHLTGRVLRN
ncbi:ABC transporter ATP-binding protein [Bacillus massiliigorillae]|uniref:ABC transporter ATP-binding protein n=1 Tax=Bacillus massiliigorillae TaxID=1243664 RepID=UPI0005A9718B|nr:ABC transporter ATP-binding protein [Bacillus massiliigorillae]